MSRVVQDVAVLPTDAAPDAAPAYRFLLELDNAWALLRLYGERHPAFLRSADAVAASAARAAVSVSIHPKGFSCGTTPIDADALVEMSKRLRSMGLVGLNVEPGLTATQVVALLGVLDGADRSQSIGEPVVRDIAAASGQRVKAVPLRLGGLRLVEGTAPRELSTAGLPVDGDADAAAIWHGLFAGTLGATAGADADPSAAAAVNELARKFEAAVGGAHTAARWNTLAAGWIQQLGTLAVTPTDAPRGGGSETPIESAAANGDGDGDGIANANANANGGGLGGDGTGSGGGGEGGGAGTSRLDAAASFLQALSPMICRRLLAQTANDPAVPEHVVLALAERLPTDLVLGALSAVDRSGTAPSSAALALLRKVSSNVATDGRDPSTSAAAATPQVPQTNRELAETAASLQKLLQSTREADFVPAEYLQRREELSRHALGTDDPADGSSGAAAPAHCPTDRDTSRRAAEVALHLLASSDAGPGHLAAGLEFAAHRMGKWARAGDFDLASRAAALAHKLSDHADGTVASTAREMILAGVSAEDLAEGAAHWGERERAVAGIAELLRQADGALLAGVLCSVKRLGGRKGDPDGPVFEAAARVLPEASDGFVRRLVELSRDKHKHADALVTAIGRLPEEHAMRAAAAIVEAHGPAAVRYAVVDAVFRRGFRWPMAMTERLLEDDEPGVRRLAVMRLVRDGGPAVAATYLSEATLQNRFKTDVPIGIAELLWAHRHEPDVCKSYRRWMWSGRRWMALLSFSFSSGRRAG